MSAPPPHIARRCRVSLSFVRNRILLNSVACSQDSPAMHLTLQCRSILFYIKNETASNSNKTINKCSEDLEVLLHWEPKSFRCTTLHLPCTYLLFQNTSASSGSILKHVYNEILRSNSSNCSVNRNRFPSTFIVKKEDREAKMSSILQNTWNWLI